MVKRKRREEKRQTMKGREEKKGRDNKKASLVHSTDMDGRRNGFPLPCFLQQYSPFFTPGMERISASVMPSSTTKLTPPFCPLVDLLERSSEGGE